ncbi:MAG: SprT family zinc-dependent metalloprotease [Caulobacter sp.]|nr:SprT family zinc-dependent metalloprotease [Caulobacter sp.]
MKLFNRAGFSHGDRVQAGEQTVRLAVNARARRISLRIDRIKREAIAIAPSASRLPEAVAFARERSDWIVGQLADLPAAAPLLPDSEIMVFGEPVLLTAAAGRAKLIAATDDAPARLLAPDDAAFGDRVLRLVKAEARRWLTDRTGLYAAALGQPMPKVAITDTRGRWGSCRPASARGAASIRYSWRLALAPAEVADYVAAHECAHLLEANHGPGFWALVRQINGDPARHRDWLRREGGRLQAVGRV